MYLSTIYMFLKIGGATVVIYVPRESHWWAITDSLTQVSAYMDFAKLYVTDHMTTNVDINTLAHLYTFYLASMKSLNMIFKHIWQGPVKRCR